MTLRGDRLPRELHPGAWWIWALGMATAATRTTNPLLLGAIIAVVALVVAARRGDSPWSRGFRGYVIVALVVIAVRVASADGPRRPVRRTRPVPATGTPVAGRSTGHRDRWAGVARRLARGVLRRPPAGDVDPLLRRGERARQPEAVAQVDAERSARDRCVDHSRAVDGSAARRERASRPSRAEDSAAATPRESTSSARSRSR